MKVATNAELRVRLRFEASQSKRAIGRFRLVAAQNEDLIKLLHPPKLEPWQLVGPFKSRTCHRASPTSTSRKRRWTSRRSTGRARGREMAGEARVRRRQGHSLGAGYPRIHGAHYLYRTLTVPADRKLDVSLRADDAFKLWVNDQLVAQRPTRRTTTSCA